MDRMVPPALPNNQLLFNLNPGIVPPTFPTRFHAPQPIIIEKFDAGNFLLSNVSSPAAPLQFSYISQDSLSKALKAVQQDIRQPKSGASSPERQAPVKTVHAGNSHRRTKIVNSQEYLKRLQNRQLREPQPLPIREHAARTPQRDVITQTCSPRNNAAANLSSMPVRSFSPPTRDLTHDEKMLVEISRLRVEITKCLRQIKQIETQRGHNKDRQLDEDEAERARRTTRAEEQSVRSARTIYALNQQITQLQDELARTDLASIQTSKKSQFVSRLASLHRHVVRALQVHVRHLSDADVCRGVTAGCRDLAAVIRRLSLSCAQLEVATDTAQPDDLIALLNDVLELTRIAESSYAVPIAPQPPRPPPPSPDVAMQRDPAPAVVSRPNVHQTENRNKSNRAGSQPPQVNNRYRAAPVPRPVSASLSDRFVTVVHSRKLPPDTVDRRSQLRSGIEAVMRNNAFTDESHHGHGAPVLPATTAGTQSDAAKARLRTKIRGVLINRSQNQTKQPRSENRDRVVRPCCASHYADPTVSTTLREQATKHAASSPGRLRDQSLVVENYGHCPAEICDWRDIQARPVQHSVNEGSPSRLRFAARDNELSPRSRSRSPSPAQNRPGNTAWKERIERQFQSTLEPVLDQSQKHMRTSAASDALLSELINDAAAELHNRQTDNFADQRSAFMRDAPSVEILLQRLNDMELEQDAIRQRWTTLVYGDDGSTRHRRSDEPPGTNGTTSSDRAILFTRRQPTGNQRGPERLALLRTVLDGNVDDESAAESDRLLEESSKRLMTLRLTRESVHSIEQNVDRYAEYLAARSHRVNSRFNPWMAVERIADDILETCIEDVAKELDEINNDIVDHVYKSEFAVA